MKHSDQITDFIARQEGFKAKAYKPLPTDRWTIGYGTTFYEDGSPVQENDVISESEAKDLVDIALDKLDSRLNNQPILSNITQNQYDAVVSLCYNIGFGAFSKSLTADSFYRGHNISNKFTAWIYSGGRIVQGLENRREKEKVIYDSGDYGV